MDFKECLLKLIVKNTFKIFNNDKNDKIFN